MNSSNTVALECNKKTKINFNGGDLSPGSGLLLIHDSAAKVGLIRLYIFFHPIRSGYYITLPLWGITNFLYSVDVIA